MNTKLLRITVGMLFLLAATIVFPLRMVAQQQRNAVTVNVNLIPPYSVYLTDYISPGSNKFLATLVFNDYNEPSWDVYLKVRIESNNLRIRSRVDFIPSRPITLLPGVPFQLSGDQLATYFDLNNIEVTGMSKADLSTSGRLIEGNYTFCIEVYDYKKHTSVSSEACALANIRLNEPPRLVMPDDQGVIALNSPNINFQWQLTSGDPSTTKYQLSIYELSGNKISPTVAVQNNQANKVFESALLNTPFFIYDINSPLLKKGVKYAWRVQALNTDNRDVFKNKGFSLVRSFSYGYPENGIIKLNSPTDGHAFSLRESKTFRWNAPDNLTSNQPYFYRLKIVKVQPEQLDSDAIAGNIPVFSNQSQLLNPQSPDYEVTAPSNIFQSQQKFAWKVTAHTNDQTIASSPVYGCYGPPLIEAFYAGNHTVFVTNTTSSNISDLTGDGEVKISYTGTTQKVHFEHIRIEAVGALLIMKKGCVKAKYAGENINLKAEYAGNGKAAYEVDSIMIDTEYMRLKGIVDWVFPHQTIRPENATVKSVPTWVIFEDYVLTGTTRLKGAQVYDLADPYGFTLNLDTTSYFILRGSNNYCPYLNGKITLPQNVKNASGEKVVLPFSATDRLDFIDQKLNPGKSSIELLKGTGINLYANSYIIDLSETKSPNKLSGQPDWKGVYIAGSSIEFPLSPDKTNQLFFKYPLQYKVRDTVGVNDTCWITTEGLQFNVNKAAEKPDSIWFNTFPGVFGSYGLNIRNSTLIKGFFKGNMAIPLLSETDRFSFTVPLTTSGFATGYLDKSLDGLAVVFNPDGGEQKINLTVNRAVFADKMRLDMNVDLSWPFIDITMQSLEGLKVWGNGNIGFQVPNGITPLSKQLQTKIKGYEMTIDFVGCGRQGNLYSFGTSANIVMAEDVSGPDGAPKVNIFSIKENSLLSGSNLSTGLPDIYQNVLKQSGGKSVFGTDTTGNAKQSVAQSGDSIDTDAMGKTVNQQMLLAIAKLGKGGATVIDSTSLLPSQAKAVNDSTIHVTVNIKSIIAMIDMLMPFLKEEQQSKALAFKAKLEEYDQSELVLIYNELSDYQKFLKELAKEAVRSLVAKINAPIIEESKKIKTSIIGFVNTKRDSLLSFIDTQINNLVDSIAKNAIQALSPSSKPGSETEIAGIISDLSDAVEEGVTTGINHSVELSVKKNVTDKIIGIIDTAVVFKITTFVDSAILRTGYAIIDKGVNANLRLDALGEQAKNLLPSIGKDVLHRVTTGVMPMVKNIIIDSYKDIRWDSVGMYIGKQMLIALVESTVGKKVDQAITNVATSVFGESGGEIAGAVAGSLVKNVKLDFSNLGEKLKKGQFDKIIKFDPSYIKVPTPIAVFEGWVKFTNDDPLWGDSWQATITAQIKVGAEFTVTAKYVNGTTAAKKKDSGSETVASGSSGYKYWFLQIGVEGLNIPLSPLPVTLDEVEGKVFHHMRRVSTGVYLPNDSVRFGAGLQMFFFDTSTSGSIVAFNVAAEISILDGGFIFEMFGDALIGNKNIKVKKVNLGTYALATATGYLGFNSIEHHFVGIFDLKFNTSPILCAGGELSIDIRPGSWSVAVGTRAKPIYIAIFCSHKPQFQGWLDANNNGIDMGFMAYIDVRAECPFWIGLPGFKIKPWAAFKLDFGATAIIDFKPFAIEEAHVWLDIYAGIGVEYKCFFASGDLTIAAINIGGEVLFTTHPKTYIKGGMHGKVTVFNISVGFDLSVEHEFS